MKNKKLAVLALTAGLSVLSCIPAFAGQWKQDSKGWWYQEDNGSYPASTWKEINGKQYYFGADGYMLANTTTPDGYTVNGDGEWVDGSKQSVFKDISEYFNTDLQDFEKAKVILGAKTFSEAYDVDDRECYYYWIGVKSDLSNVIQGFTDDDTINKIAIHPRVSMYNENRTLYDAKNSFELIYDKATNQIISVKGDPMLFVNGIDGKVLHASDVRDLAKSAGAQDIEYKNTDREVPVYGIRDGGAFYDTGEKNIERNDEVTFTLNGLKYSYKAKAAIMNDNMKFVITRN